MINSRPYPLGRQGHRLSPCLHFHQVPQGLKQSPYLHFLQGPLDHKRCLLQFSIHRSQIKLCPQSNIRHNIRIVVTQFNHHNSNTKLQLPKIIEMTLCNTNTLFTKSSNNRNLHNSNYNTRLLYSSQVRIKTSKAILLSLNNSK